MFRLRRSALFVIGAMAVALGFGCPRAPVSGPDAGPSDSGLGPVDAGADAGLGDSGIVYTPYYCSDAGAGSAFDRHDHFIAPDGTDVGVTVCGPMSGGPVLRIAPPSDGGSSALLLNQATLAAADGGLGTLLLATGVYDFVGWDAGTNWLLQGARDLVIDGQGSTLLFHDLKAGLMLAHDQRVLIRNLQVDWSEPLAMGGTLSPASPLCDGGMSFDVDSAYPIDPAQPPPLISMSEFNVATPRWPLVPFAQAFWAQKPASDRAQYVSGQTYCVVDPQALKGLDAGTPAIGISRTQGGNGVFVTSSGNISFENVTVYAAPGEAFTFNTGALGFRMSRCRVTRNTADPRRLISSNADGVNFRQTLGDVLLEDSEFADQGDDGVSVLGQFFAVQPGSTATTLTLGPNDAVTIQTGDSLTLAQPDFTFVGSALVTQVTPIRDAGTVLGATVELAPPGILPLGDGGTPLALDGGLLGNVPARSSPNFILRNVYVHDNDQRALLVQTANGLVDHYTAVNDRGIFLVAQYGVFLEGPGASNVVVQNSRLVNCDFMTTATPLGCAGSVGASPAPISVVTLTPDHAFISSRPNSNIVLQNNVVDGAPGIGMLVSSAAGVQVTGNTLLNTNQQTLTTSCGPALPLPLGSIVALDATGIVFTGNMRDGGTSLGLTLDPSCTACTGQSGY